MKTATPSRPRLAFNSVLLVILVMAVPLLVGTGGVVHSWSGLDLHYLSLPLILAGVLSLLGHMAFWVQRTSLGARMVVQRVCLGEQRQVAVLEVAGRLLVDSAWLALTWGLLASISRIPSTISAQPSGVNVTTAASYLQAFDSLAIWAVILLFPFIIARAISQVWPRVRRSLRMPASRLAVFGLSFVLLTEEGVLHEAFDISGSGVLVGIGVALGLSYAASILRAEVSRAKSPESLLITRASLVLAEAGWMVALLAAVAALPSAVEPAIAQRYSGDLRRLTHYIELSRALFSLSIVILAPFAVAHAASALWPAVRRVVVLPVGRFMALAVAYVLFSGNGVVATELQADLSQFLVVLAFVFALTYLTSLLVDASRSGLAGTIGPTIGSVLPVANAVVVGSVPAILVWAVLSSLPEVGALLLLRSMTRDFAETYAGHFAGLSDVRVTVAGAALILGLTLALPKSLSPDLRRYQFLLAAAGFNAAACLVWVTGARLSELSHAYTLSGAVASAGLFSLALAQLSGYATTSPNPLVADVGRWLSESRIRGFILGVAIAYYGLVLHPILHEVTPLAALYEYVAVLLLLMSLLFASRKRLRLGAATPYVRPPAWLRWTHHRQRLETKTDPRSVEIGDLQRRFVEGGDWLPVSSYLLGLVVRIEAPIDSVMALCQALRRAALCTRHRPLPGERRRNRARRMSALRESIAAAEEGLTSPRQPTPLVDEALLRDAAEDYILSESDPVCFVATLCVAHFQRGDDLNSAIYRWIPLLGSPKPRPKWYAPPWVRSKIMTREREYRARFVDEVVAVFYGETPRPMRGRRAQAVGAAV